MIDNTNKVLQARKQKGFAENLPENKSAVFCVCVANVSTRNLEKNVAENKQLRFYAILKRIF